jgi:hypothetical protein
MRGLGSLTLALAAVAAPLFTSEARADTMDPALNRLVLVDANNPDCRTRGPGGGVYYNPISGYRRCSPDNAAWGNLVAQYGAALAPSGMHSSRTTGYGGLELALEADFTSIDNKQPYWQNGTQGPQDPVSKKFSVIGDPDPVIQTYMLKIRKGLPFGFELTGNVGYVARTSIVVGGADVRWSLFEGFRTGVPAIFPELAVGGSVRTITGAEQMQLTVVGADATLSKPFAIGGSVVFTPYMGYQYLRIFGDSGLIDLTPNTDALAQCNHQGTNTPASPDRSKFVDKNGNGTADPGEYYYDGQPVCGQNPNAGTDPNSPANSADFNNNVVFTPVRLNRHRLGGGFALRFQMVNFGAHFITDVVDVAQANKDQDTFDFSQVGRQWTLAFSLGALL